MGWAGLQAGSLGPNLCSIPQSGWLTLGKWPPFSLNLNLPICPYEGQTQTSEDITQAELCALAEGTAATQLQLLPCANMGLVLLELWIF